MKYIKKMFIKFKMALYGYISLKTDYLDVCDSIYSDVLVFKRGDKVRIYTFMLGDEDKYVNEYIEKDIRDAFIARQLVIVKKFTKNSDVKCLIYNFASGSVEDAKEIVLDVVSLSPMEPGKESSDGVGFGKIKYVGERFNGELVLYDKNLNVVFDKVIDYAYFKSTKRDNYIAVILDTAKKYHIINDLGQVSPFTYDFVKPLIDNSKVINMSDSEKNSLPILCYFRENEGDKESKMLYHFYFSEYIDDSYLDLSGFRTSIDESTNRQYFYLQDRETKLWALANSKGNLLTEFEYSKISDVTSDMFFVHEDTGIHLMAINGLKKFAKPYKRIYEPFKERVYGCFKMNLAVASSWQRIYYLDTNGMKYEMFEEYEYNDEPFFN
ncbi:MAG: hypothetical protein MJ244_06230 [Clostridia bacterium]|nr:hypothetical protein [Clostridia bacterium]